MQSFLLGDQIGNSLLVKILWLICFLSLQNVVKGLFDALAFLVWKVNQSTRPMRTCCLSSLIFLENSWLIHTAGFSSKKSCKTTAVSWDLWKAPCWKLRHLCLHHRSNVWIRLVFHCLLTSELLDEARKLHLEEIGCLFTSSLFSILSWTRLKLANYLSNLRLIVWLSRWLPLLLNQWFQQWQEVLLLWWHKCICPDFRMWWNLIILIGFGQNVV